MMNMTLSDDYTSDNISSTIINITSEYDDEAVVIRTMCTCVPNQYSNDPPIPVYGVEYNEVACTLIDTYSWLRECC